MILSTALRSLKLYRIHVKSHMLCPHPFCVYIQYVSVYILGACYHIKVQEQWTQNGYPPYEQVWWEKPHTLFFSLPLSVFLSIFPFYLFISQWIISCLIVLYYSCPTNSSVLPLAKVALLGSMCFMILFV